MTLPILTPHHHAQLHHCDRALENLTRRLRVFRECMESPSAQAAYTTGTVLSEQEYSEEVLNKLEYLWQKLDEFRDEFKAILDLED